MRVLVTGSAGFVGRHFVRHYHDRNDDVVEVDIRNDDDCRRFFAWSDMRYDLVIHCAAVVGGRTMIDGQPLHLACEDLSIDAALFAWALRTRPKRIVYFSSSAAYPVWAQTEGCAFRLHEDLIGDDQTYGLPDQTYGWVKLTGERLAAEANAEGIRTHVFRPFSGYGTDQHLDYPFPAIIGRAWRAERPFDIWGRGDSARDWIHVDDIVGAVQATIDADVVGPLNLCTGRATTFEQLARMAMTAAAYESPIRYLGDQPTGVHWRVGDPTLLHQIYTPRVTLEEGIARALKGTP
jgi:nucleoside-diphosphate-sugar epimerase